MGKALERGCTSIHRDASPQIEENLTTQKRCVDTPALADGALLPHRSRFQGFYFLTPTNQNYAAASRNTMGLFSRVPCL